MSITTFPSDATIQPASVGGVKRVKFGIDPTAPRMHLGHLVPLLQVKRLIDMGHQAHIIYGTFTALLGDPSGRDAMRPILEMQTVSDNATNIASVVHRILQAGDDRMKYVYYRNHSWLGELTAPELMSWFAKFTVTQLLSRDAFQKRMGENAPIGAHELLVPILQGYDSVHLNADIEIGGTDQLFNFQIARQMQEMVGQTPEICLLCPIINGTDGRKMSKTYDNCIWLDDKPTDVYGKVMSTSDEMMEQWIPLFVDDMHALDVLYFNGAGETMGPMARKKVLAHRITSLIYDQTTALAAEQHFEHVIQAKDLPAEIPVITVKSQAATLVHAIAAIRECSMSEARRLLEQGGVSINGEKAYNDGPVKTGEIIKVGKRHFGRIQYDESKTE